MTSKQRENLIMKGLNPDIYGYNSKGHIVKKNKTQCVKDHLRHYKKITSWEAIKKYKATRLAAIIFNIKKELKAGWTIKTIDHKSKDGAPYAEYKLIKTFINKS